MSHVRLGHKLDAMALLEHLTVQRVDESVDALCRFASADAKVAQCLREVRDALIGKWELVYEREEDTQKPADLGIREGTRGRMLCEHECDIAAEIAEERLAW